MGQQEGGEQTQLCDVNFACVENTSDVVAVPQDAGMLACNVAS
jgi:hypothetical protein